MIALTPEEFEGRWLCSFGISESIGTIATIASVAGSVASAGGALYSGMAQSSAASYQAQIAQNNANIAMQNARYAAAAGVVQAQNTSLQSASAGGRIRASIGANNVDVNSGSAEDTQKSQREVGQYNTLAVANNAALQVYGYRAAASGDQAQAALDSAEAEEAPIGGALSAGGSLLSNASSLGIKWAGAQQPTDSQWQSYGVFGGPNNPYASS